MGTNYYVVPNRPSRDEWHIGKSSCGWLFHFQSQNEGWGDPPVVWNTYNQVKDWLKKNTVDSDEFVIINEYDEVISFDEFFDLVDSKQNDKVSQANPDNFNYLTKNVDGYRFSDGEFS